MFIVYCTINIFDYLEYMDLKYKILLVKYLSILYIDIIHISTKYKEKCVLCFII